MSKSNSPTPYPVDSTTRPCCGGIGNHTQACSTVAPVQLGEVIDEVIDRLIAQRKDTAIAGLVSQLNDANARIRQLQAEVTRLEWEVGR